MKNKLIICFGLIIFSCSITLGVTFCSDFKSEISIGNYITSASFVESENYYNEISEFVEGSTATIENVYLFIPKKYRKNTHILLSNISEQIFSYVKGTGLITLVVFIVSFLSFSITGLRGALFLALWNAITNIIPYVGPYIGGIPIILFAFTTDYRMGIIILIIVILIQLIESYILHPIVMSKTMKLHPVTIIISLIIFGHYFGIIGMLIATPVTAIIKTIWLFLDEKYRITEKISKE